MLVGKTKVPGRNQSENESPDRFLSLILELKFSS